MDRLFGKVDVMVGKGYKLFPEVSVPERNFEKLLLVSVIIWILGKTLSNLFKFNFQLLKMSFL